MDLRPACQSGTLRIPSFLRHNKDRMVDREFSGKDSIRKFKTRLMEMKQYPYVVKYLDGINWIDDIEETT